MLTDSVGIQAGCLALVPTKAGNVISRRGLGKGLAPTFELMTGACSDLAGILPWVVRVLL